MIIRSISLSALLSMPVFAATTISEQFIVSTVVPDNDPTGFVDYQEFTNPELIAIENVEVELEFSGGWNGDLYVLLQHSAGHAVLLNRPGRTLAEPDGAGSSGMTITLSDTADRDVHIGLATSGTNIAGVFQPDGRESDPLSVVETDLRTATLSAFDGLDPNGTWGLLVVDQGAGDQSTLESWTLTLAATSIPEPVSSAMLLLGAMLGALRRSRSV